MTNYHTVVAKILVFDTFFSVENNQLLSVMLAPSRIGVNLLQ